MDHSSDDAVIGTNDDAAICKYQAVKNGYYKDDHLGLFLNSEMKNQSRRKAPEINRGYYARSAAIACLVEQFITRYPDGQIISLGAGYDTLYWRLMSRNFLRDCPSPSEDPSPIKYVEVDMDVVVNHKLMSIERFQQIRQAGWLQKDSTEDKSVEKLYERKDGGLFSNRYNLFPFDLRQVDKSKLGVKLFEQCHLDPSSPTLCISECVLVYMTTQDSSSLIKWFSDNFSNLTFLNYEQCNMKDRFGDVMLQNMIARHCDLMGVDACKSMDSQLERFKTHGLDNTRFWLMSDIYKNCLSRAEIQRIEKIEFLDEKELLEQLLQHYCIVLASHTSLDWIQDDHYWEAKTM